MTIPFLQLADKLFGGTGDPSPTKGNATGGKTNERTTSTVRSFYYGSFILSARLRPGQIGKYRWSPAPGCDRRWYRSAAHLPAQPKARH